MKSINCWVVVDFDLHEIYAVAPSYQRAVAEAIKKGAETDKCEVVKSSLSMELLVT